MTSSLCRLFLLYVPPKHKFNFFLNISYSLFTILFKYHLFWEISPYLCVCHLVQDQEPFGYFIFNAISVLKNFSYNLHAFQSTYCDFFECRTFDFTHLCNPHSYCAFNKSINVWTEEVEDTGHGMFWDQMKLSIREKFWTAPHPSNHWGLT